MPVSRSPARGAEAQKKMHVLQKQKAISEEADLYQLHWDSQQQSPVGLQCFTSSASECTDTAMLHTKTVYPEVIQGPLHVIVEDRSTPCSSHVAQEVWEELCCHLEPRQCQWQELNLYNSFTWMFWEDCRAKLTLKYTALHMTLAVSYSLPYNKVLGAMTSPSSAHQDGHKDERHLSLPLATCSLQSEK